MKRTGMENGRRLRMSMIGRSGRKSIITVVSVLACASLEAGEASSLEDYGMLRLPSGVELSQEVYAESLLSTISLTSEDIALDFSNIDDLSWLRGVADSSICVMLGESHYGRAVYALENRFVFALNTYGSYPLVVLELQYSLTPFINHYLDLEDDQEAAEYLEDVRPVITSFEEDLERLVHIRRWNRTHPGREVHVGCSDIEHDLRTTLCEILLPYLTQADPSLGIDPENTFHLDLLDRMADMRAAADSARRTGVRGEYPFVTPDYIDRVLDNLESTCHAYSEGRMNFDFMRQQAIVRNLTDEGFLGSWTRNGSFIVICGGWHARAGAEYPYGASFLSEGSYFQHEFEPTAGRVFSVFIDNYSFSLDAMDGVDLATCGQLGSGYRRMISLLQEVCGEGLASPSDRLVLFRGVNDLDRLLLSAAERSGGSPVLLMDVDLDGLSASARASGFEEYVVARTELLRSCECYDALVVMPSSPVARASVEEPQAARTGS